MDKQNHIITRLMATAQLLMLLLLLMLACRHAHACPFACLPILQMYREAAVLSQLGHHPCIVHFYGLVVEQLAANVKESHQHAALSASSFTGSFTGSGNFTGSFTDSLNSIHDSAGSGGSFSSLCVRALGGGLPAAAGKAGARLSVGLVMERCDMSLQQWRQGESRAVAACRAAHRCVHCWRAQVPT